MTIQESIQKINEELTGKSSEKNGVISVEAVIAERKAFLSHKKLTYSFKVKIDEETKKLKFTEMLKESGSGLSSGGSFGNETTAGFGFKTESYNTFGGGGARQGSIEESSKLFGKNYQYTFDYSKIRNQIESAAKENGYEFEYQVIPVGF